MMSAYMVVSFLVAVLAGVLIGRGGAVSNNGDSGEDCMGGAIQVVAGIVILAMDIGILVARAIVWALWA